MTENEYTHLLMLYHSCNYNMCMDFQEFIERYAKRILEAYQEEEDNT